MIEPTNSKFMSDSTKGSGGREAVLDFELSWVLRMAADEETGATRPLLYHQCRTIFAKLFGIEGPFVINDVKVWKQYDEIDLWIESHITINGQLEKHAMIIEDKAYSEMKVHQRDDYPLRALSYYQGLEEWADLHFHQCVVTCHDPGDGGNEQLNDFCKGTNWKIYSIVELPDWDCPEKTESDLFNEFWFTSWNPIED